MVRKWTIVCGFVGSSSKDDRRARAEERKDDGDGRCERRGDGDGDGEIGGARRARRVGFVDAKEEADG